MPLSDLEQRISAAIAKRSKQLREQLAQHVAIPTGQDYATGLADYRSLMIEQLKRLGADVHLIDGAARPAWLELPGAATGAHSPPPTVVAQRRAKRSGPRVLIAGHLDTVHDPHGSFKELTIGPDGRTATGPGAADMKGGIVIALNALEVLAEVGVDLNWTFLLNSDEESGSFHSFEAITKAAREHDVGIALEPALPDGSLVVERMGSAQFKIEVFGRAAHVGRDFVRGVSAVTKLAEIITQIAALSNPKGGTIVNVGPLQGGPVTNIVPDYAACWGNMRFTDAKSQQMLERSLDALTTKNDQLPRVVVHRLVNRPAKPQTDSVRKLAQAARHVAEDLGQSLSFGSTGGVCDGNIMQAAGLATIDTLGVRGGNLHRLDEFIELPSLVERCQLLAILLARLGQ